MSDELETFLKKTPGAAAILGAFPEQHHDKLFRMIKESKNADDLIGILEDLQEQIGNLVVALKAQTETAGKKGIQELFDGKKRPKTSGA